MFAMRQELFQKFRQLIFSRIGEQLDDIIQSVHFYLGLHYNVYGDIGSFNNGSGNPHENQKFIEILLHLWIFFKLMPNRIPHLLSAQQNNLLFSTINDM